MAPVRLLFFGVLGEIIRRCDLGQHPGHDLIGQVLKGSMNLSFQVSKFGRLVPQLGDPLPFGAEQKKSAIRERLESAVERDGALVFFIVSLAALF